jgi:hypothetical protein
MTAAAVTMTTAGNGRDNHRPAVTQRRVEIHTPLS